MNSSTPSGSVERPALPVALSMRGIRRSFGPVQALGGVDFELRGGEIHALLGENGAGKTTLMNVLFGLCRPDAGSIEVFGQPVAMHSPREAVACSIGMVHQHFMLVPGLTVAENLVLGAGGGEGLTLDLSAARRAVGELCRRHQLQPLDPDLPVEDLSVGQAQRLEILKALHRRARILILDEPTAVLTPSEVEELFRELALLRDQGHSLIFISHKLSEIRDICDRVTVLRRGKSVATLSVKQTTPEQLGELMVGRSQPGIETESRAPAQPSTVLALKSVSTAGRDGGCALKEISLKVAAGEIVGVAGIDGNGQAELEELLAGVRAPASGQLLYEGECVNRMPPNRRHRMGWAVIPADRRETGLVLGLSLEDNLILKSHRRPEFSRAGLLDRSAIREHAKRAIAEYAIAAADPRVPVDRLSGGNQQKVVVARELSGGPKFLAAFSPTRGLDVGATGFVHRTLLSRKAAGLAILLVSTELDEILMLADRIAVLCHGRITELPPKEYDRQHIGQRMMGQP